jgi:hypothetical protein
MEPAMGKGRPPNSAKTVAITISTTKVVRDLLEVLAEDGTYGKNAAEAANWLIGEKLRELRKGGDILAERLNQAQRNFYTENNKAENQPGDKESAADMQ